MHESTIIQRALLTVSDKTNIVELAERLHLRGVELISTGNTAKVLKEHGLPVIQVGDYTGFPEMMDGRVKTLHPKIHGGILGRRDKDADIMHQHDIPDIDLIVVNLYPFQQTIANPTHQLEDAIENIDIGGPTLIRAAAKNYEWCSVLVDPNDYQAFMDELDKNDGAVKQNMRFYLASKAFSHTAQYDTNIAQYLNQRLDNQGAANTLTLTLTLKEHLRYGENPHQQADFYVTQPTIIDSITQAKVLQGKALSFNNIVDGDTALECVKQFEEPSCVIVKHANPCGVSREKNLTQAYDKAYACDPTSAFGGIIAFNSAVDEKLIAHIFGQQFVEMIIAPDFTEGALKACAQKPNCRVLQYTPSTGNSLPEREIKSVRGGLLVQSYNDVIAENMQVVTLRSPSPTEMEDLAFAWRVAKFVKSNAIVFARDTHTLGIGAGQMSRIFSTEIGAMKAQQVQFSLQGAVMASDAFFPFKDNVEKAHALGIRAIIQPGGSIKDEDVIQCANELDMAMVFTQTRHFKH